MHLLKAQICLVLVLASVLTIQAEDQSLTYSYSTSAPTTTFTLRVFTGDNTVNVLQLVGGNGQIEPLAATSDSISLNAVFTYNSNTAIVSNGARTFTLAADTTGGNIAFKLRGVASASSTTSTDREYRISTANPPSSNINEPGVLIQPNTITVIPGATPAAALNVVDPDTKSFVAQRELFESMQLQFQFSTSNWYPKVVLAGARVTECTASNNLQFLSTGSVGAVTNKAVMFIDSNGCCTDTPFIGGSCPVTGGFSKDSSSTQTIGGAKNFVAYTPFLEVIGFADFEEANSYNTINEVYIRCKITPCYDDSTTGNGVCGGNHCSPPNGRKRRATEDNSENGTVVQTKITLLNRRPKKTQCCTETTLYSGTLGALGTLTAIMFGVMVFVYFDTKGVLSGGQSRGSNPSSRHSVHSSRRSSEKIAQKI